MYDPKDWNYHDSSIFITNNPCESNNHHLNSVFHGKKPKFYYCLINLIKELDEQKELYFKKIKDVYSNISIFNNNNYSSRYTVIYDVVRLRCRGIFVKILKKSSFFLLCPRTFSWNKFFHHK